MGYIATDLIMIGCACIYCKANWLIPSRKYLMCFFLTAGFALAALASLSSLGAGVAIIFAFLAIGCLYLLIRCIVRRNRDRIEILHLPAGSYDIVADDRPGSSDTQLRYRLIYQNMVYTLSTTPPIGKPALTLYAETHEKQNITFGHIALANDHEPFSIKRLFHRCYGVVVFIFALLLRWTVLLQESNYDLFEVLFEGFLIIVFGYVGVQTFCTKDSLLIKLLYYFCMFLSIMGWVGFPFLLFS